MASVDQVAETMRKSCRVFARFHHRAGLLISWSIRNEPFEGIDSRNSRLSKPGILFYDLTTLLQNPGGFHALVDNLCDHYAGNMVDASSGIEARGFILAPALAYRLNAASSPFASPRSCHRKQLQLPTSSSTARIRSEIHQDAIKPGQRVLISDDLLATGGTAAATVELVRKLGGEVVGASFAVELKFLNGRAKLPGIDIFTMIQYDN